MNSQIFLLYLPFDVGSDLNHTDETHHTRVLRRPLELDLLDTIFASNLPYMRALLCSLRSAGYSLDVELWWSYTRLRTTTHNTG